MPLRQFPHWQILVLLWLTTVVPVLRSQRCSSFKFDMTNVKLTSATFFDARSLVNISSPLQAIETYDLPAFCRVQLNVTTNVTVGSIALAEVWLPVNWNGRFLTVGNAGFSGGVAVADLALVAVKQGYAGLSTDSGHSAPPSDGSWALGNDNAIIDFGWRAMHLSVAAGKEAVRAFYGRPHNKAYFIGCSEGGRQGLKEVQKFPHDFDGVVVGSPANWGSHFLASLVRGSQMMGQPNSSQWISDDMWTDVIHPEVLRQCDRSDGLEDGIINNPEICGFRPEMLACRSGQEPTHCLSQGQMETLRGIYSDYYANQTWVFGGFYPGAERGLSQYIFRADPVQSGVQYFQYFVTNDTTWTQDQLNASIIELADQINPGDSNAINTDLRVFGGPGHNGKILHYVGWAENLISAGGSLHYYRSVENLMRLYGVNMDDFYRLFVIPGMEHCYLGHGANAFGGVAQELLGMPPIAHDATHDILAALVRWVEEDHAPDVLIAAHYNDDNAAAGISFTRPICKYPASAFHLAGRGNPIDASSFTCL